MDEIMAKLSKIIEEVESLSLLVDKDSEVGGEIELGLEHLRYAFDAGLES